MTHLTHRAQALAAVLVGFLLIAADVHDAAAQEAVARTVRSYQVTRSEDLTWYEDPEFPEVDRADMYGSMIFAEPYVYRLRANGPAHIPLHGHERREHFTVLQGKMHHALEDRTREAADACGPGCFIVLPVGQRHQLWLEPGTILQVHGVGPTEARAIVRPSKLN